MQDAQPEEQDDGCQENCDQPRDSIRIGKGAEVGQKRLERLGKDADACGEKNPETNISRQKQIVVAWEDAADQCEGEGCENKREENGECDAFEPPTLEGGIGQQDRPGDQVEKDEQDGRKRYVEQMFVSKCKAV